MVQARDDGARDVSAVPRTCLGANPFGYEGGLAALEVVRVLRHAWVGGDQPGVDLCLAAGADVEGLIGPAPPSEDMGSVAAVPGYRSMHGVTFTNEPAVEADPGTGEPVARTAAIWDGRYVEFTVSLAGDPQVVAVEQFVPPISYEASGAVLQRYLDDLARGDFEAAAGILAVGDAPLDHRADLDDLVLSGTSTAALAHALAAYCTPRCAPPVTIAHHGLDRERGFLLTAYFDDGREREFVVWGSAPDTALVRGLPPVDG